MDLLRERSHSRPFTGHHMIAVMVLFFGTIIAVNLVMARFALTTWSGLVVPNTYVASQEFNARAAEAKAVAALGNAIAFEGDRSGFSVLLTGRDGVPLRSAAVTATLHRPAGTIDDRDETMRAAGNGRYVADGRLKAGDWIVHVVARDGAHILYNAASRIHVAADGSIRP